MYSQTIPICSHASDENSFAFSNFLHSYLFEKQISDDVNISVVIIDIVTNSPIFSASASDNGQGSLIIIKFGLKIVVN